jgi:hypothetical protein
MAEPEGDGGVPGLRRELARERRELAVAVEELERSVARGRRLGKRRLAVVAGTLGTTFVVAGALVALARITLRRRAERRRDRVLLGVGDFVLVRRSG